MFHGHGIFARFATFGRSAWLLAVLAIPAFAQDGEPADALAPEPPREMGLIEDVEVAGRLGAGRPVPGSPGVVVVPAEALITPGARSLPEALAIHPSVQWVDQVGNGRQLSLDLRGFSGAEGATALIVDGVRMNDADTNVAAWELLRLEDVERVEISPGPRGATIGGGSLAGTIHVVRRRPSADKEFDLRLRGGQDSFRDASAVATGPAGRWRLLASGAAFEDDGFRREAGSRERAGRVAAETDIGAATISVGWSRIDGRWRHPGALTADELRADATAAPFNMLDAQDASMDLLMARVETDLRRTKLIVVAAFRNKDSDTLTTGRSQYGYRVLDSQQSISLAFEGETEIFEHAGRRLALRWGAEASRDKLHPRGFATDDVSDGAIEAEELSSAADVDWDRRAVFTGMGLALGPGLSLDLSLRHDASEVERVGGEHGPSGLWEITSGSRAFGDTSFRLGAGGSRDAGAAGLSWRMAWEESFLAPSAIQLFAYPGFSSNPDLEPQRGSGPSAGITLAATRFEIALDVFETRVDREIAYDDQAGRNINAGTTRRRGAELRAEWRPKDGVRLSLGAAVVDATHRSGFPEGTRIRKGASVPLVARHRLAASIALGPWRGFSAHLTAQRVGPSPLSNDFDGSEPMLEPRHLVALSLSREFPGIQGLTIEIAGENLLDDRHPVRGIESWDERYFTPSAPRRVTAGVAWRFR